MLNSAKTVSFQVGDGAADNVSMTFQGMKATDLDIFDSTSAVIELANNSSTQINAAASKQAGTFTIAQSQLHPSPWKWK